MRESARWAIVVLVIAFALGATGECAEDKPQVGLSLGPWAERQLTLPGHEGHTGRSREATFDLSTIRYAIKYSACVDPAHGDQVDPIEGYIGMPTPSSENWYHGGFLFVRVNDQDIGTAPISSMVIVEKGRRGIVDMVWHHPVASVRVRFLGLHGDSKLLAEIAIEPKQEVESISVMACCYPSFFTAWHKRAGARRVKTPSTLVKEGEQPALKPADNWWLLYCDDVFDVARGEGVGPCAMAFLPDEATELSVLPGGYAVNTLIAYKPSARRLRMAFWDLRGQENAAALTAFPKMAATARKQLSEMDFTPEAVRSFDFAARRRQLDDALALPDLAEDLRAAASEHLEVLERAEALPESKAEPSIAAEEELLRSLDSFESLYWKIKLHHLLSF